MRRTVLFMFKAASAAFFIAAFTLLFVTLGFQ